MKPTIYGYVLKGDLTQLIGMPRKGGNKIDQDFIHGLLEEAGGKPLFIEFTGANGKQYIGFGDVSDIRDDNDDFELELTEVDLVALKNDFDAYVELTDGLDTFEKVIAYVESTKGSNGVTVVQRADEALMAVNGVGITFFDGDSFESVVNSENDIEPTDMIEYTVVKLGDKVHCAAVSKDHSDNMFAMMMGYRPPYGEVRL